MATATVTETLPSRSAPAVKERPLAGSRADPAKKSILQNPSAKVTNLARNIGTEIRGLQLKELNDQQLEDLALLIAERGVVFFRNQDLTPQELQRIGQKWGKLHDRVPGMSPAGVGTNVQQIRVDANSKQNPGQWHQDHSADEEPASITFLHNFEVPSEAGGDTVWASLYEAYDKLTPAFRALLEGLETLQEGAYYPIDTSYEPARGKHPLIRTHPLTGWRILYVNQAWVKQIKGFTKAESSLLINFLNQHVANGQDFQVRFRWEKNDVALWDNRATQHVATWDYFPDTRIGNRVVVRGEKPFFDPKSKSRREALGIPITPSWRIDVAHEVKDIVGSNRSLSYNDAQTYEHLRRKVENGTLKL